MPSKTRKKMPRPLFYTLLVLLGLGAAALDQWTKWLTVRAMPTPNLASNYIEAIPGFFHITHIQNQGAAWGFLSGHRWLFILIMVLFLGLLIVVVWKKWITSSFELVCLAGIAGGGLGNAIDRALTGRVTDMICLDFMDFPVFNVADCFISTFCVLLLIYILFFDKSLRKKKKKDEANGVQP